MEKIKKRFLRPVCAILLCLTLSAGSAYTSYAAMPGVFLGADEALAAVLMMLGISAASDGAYSSADALAEWGGEQIDGLVQHISTSQKYAETLGKLGTDALKAKVTEWATKAGRGVIDTASDVWGALKDWAGTLHKGIRAASSGGVSYGGRATPLDIDSSYYYLRDGSYTSFKIMDKMGVSQFASVLVSRRSSAGDVVSPVLYLYAVASVRSFPIRFYQSKEYGAGNTYYNYMSSSYEEDGLYYFALKFLSVDNSDDNIGSLGTDVSYVWDDVTSQSFSLSNLCRYINDGVTVFPASTNISVGGVGDIYERDHSLDNVGLTGVGVGTKAGDVPIDWAAWGEIAGTLEGVRTGVLDIADVMAGSKVWAYDTTRDTVIDSDKDLDNDIPIADVIPGANVSDYTITGLQDVFPFCIPFDLIDFLNVLDAEPEAPRFQWDFEYAKGKVYKFDLDLSRFETVAAAFRTFELLGFCLALILITRDKMIKG